MRLELNPDEAQFIYQVLDQITVKGVQAKAMVVSIMAKLVEKPKEDDETPAGSS